MDPPLWPRYLYYVLSIFCLPLYIMVFICLVRLRCFKNVYRTTFYTILLQHCIADIFSMIIYLTTYEFRQVPGLKHIYFVYQEYFICAISYNSVYYFLYIRCTGIIFLSINRCLVICGPTSIVTCWIQKAHTWQIVVVYWTVPTLISIFVLKDTDFYYDSLETMEVVVPRSVIMRNTLMALIIISITCLICVFSYVAMGLFLLKNTFGLSNVSRSLKREMHLAVQVLVLLSAFFIMLAHHMCQNIFSQTQNTGPIYVMRSLYSVANGILSYMNPFCILLLNRDFCKQFKRTLKCKNVRVREARVSTFSSKSVHYR